MDVKKLKYVFIILSALLLAYMLLLSRSAGVSCDEVLHYDHSIAVYNYFASHGKDSSALNTPVTHLQYYGQSFDNLTTIIIELTDIEDIYAFRHFMSSIAGWTAIIITALFAIWLAGIEATKPTVENREMQSLSISTTMPPRRVVSCRIA